MCTHGAHVHRPQSSLGGAIRQPRRGAAAALLLVRGRLLAQGGECVVGVVAEADQAEEQADEQEGRAAPGAPEGARLVRAKVRARGRARGRGRGRGRGRARVRVTLTTRSSRLATLRLACLPS